MSACTLKTSLIGASNDCCHLLAAAPSPLTCTSSGLTCTRLVPSAFLAQRTVPVSRYWTPRSAAICPGVRVEPAYCTELPRAITWSCDSSVSLPRTASETPLAKYASDESPRFSNGRTTMRAAPPSAGAP